MTLHYTVYGGCGERNFEAHAPPTMSKHFLQLRYVKVIILGYFIIIIIIIACDVPLYIYMQEDHCCFLRW